MPLLVMPCPQQAAEWELRQRIRITSRVGKTLMREQRTAAFTLVEMLTVLVIVAIIIGIAIPAVTSLTRSSGLRGGIGQIANAAQLARQFAITHRVRTQ